jgi:MFS family permease
MRLADRLAPYRDLVLVIATASIASMTISLGFPLLSLVLEREGYDAFTIGLNSAASGFGIFLVAPFVNRIVRRLGAVRTMQAAILAVAGLLLVFRLHVDPVTWFVLRLALGAAGGLMFVISEAGVNALAPPEIRGRVIAAYATTFSIGYATGPLILAAVGSAGWAPFLVAAAILIVSTLPVGRVRGLDRALASRGGQARRGLLAFWRAAPLPYLGVLVYAMIETAFFALLPIYAIHLGLLEAAAASLLAIWIAGNIVMQFPIGWLGDRWSRPAVTAISAGLAAILLLAVPAVQGSNGLIWPVFLVMGGMMGAIYTLSLTLLGERFEPAELTPANTTFVATFQIGLLAGPLLVGAAMRGIAPNAFGWSLALPLLLLVACCVIVAWRASRGGQRPA